METRQLAPDLTISRVVTGLWQIADLERDGRPLDAAATARAMEPYVEAGLTTFDMADHYGTAEEIAGAFVRGGGRDRVQLLTKWVPTPGPVSRDDVHRAVDRACRRLAVERIDLLQFHAWSYWDPSYLDALFWLDELRREGRIRRLGLTNFDTAHLRIVVESGIEVVSNQVCFSLLDRRPLDRMRELCVDSGVQLLAYGTLAGGLLTERWLGRDEPAADGLGTWSEMKYKRFVDTAGGWESLQTLLSAIDGVAKRHDVSMANVACRWVLDDPAVAAVIVGARLGESEHVRDNLRLTRLDLDDDDRAEIDGALESLAPIPGDCGDEYRRPPYLTASGDLSHHVTDFPAPYEVRPGAGGRKLVLSGTPWEPLAGYCRATRRGDRILVSGTTAVHGDRAIGGSDPAAQTHFVIDKIEGAIRSLGGRLEDVVRTRVFVRNIDQWEPVARAHGERFDSILPANSLVQAALIGSDPLVEIEAEAVVGDPVE